MTVPAAQSVVVIWGTLPQRVAAGGGVTHVAGEHLHDSVLGQRPCLKRTELTALSAANSPNLFSSESRLKRPDVAGRPSAGGALTPAALVSRAAEKGRLADQPSSPQKVRKTFSFDRVRPSAANGITTGQLALQR